MSSKDFKDINASPKKDAVSPMLPRFNVFKDPRKSKGLTSCGTNYKRQYMLKKPVKLDPITGQLLSKEYATRASREIKSNPNSS